MTIDTVGINGLEDETGLEVERENGEEPITNPFDPEKIRIRTSPLLVEQMVRRIQHEEIDLEPDFQRLHGIWSLERRSRLIESLLLRIPLPVFYVAADEEETWSVVDGIQRMSTINDFVTNRFMLKNLEYLTNLEGCEHRELPRSMQRRISETQLTVNVIEPGTPPEVMFNVFLRINTGGMPLKAQEIRHALHPDPARGFLRNLAESKPFVDATGGSVKPKRMDDRECVLRFIAFFVNGPQSYTTGNLDGFLGKTMKQINNMTDGDRAAITTDFEKAMRAARDIMGQYAFRKRLSIRDRRRPVNRALFESWSVHLAKTPPEKIDVLVKQKRQVIRNFINALKEDEEFEASITASTSSPPRVRKRFETIALLCDEVIKC